MILVMQNNLQNAICYQIHCIRRFVLTQLLSQSKHGQPNRRLADKIKELAPSHN